VHLVCPNCQGVNRLAEDRLHAGPVCARCKASLLPLAPIALSDASLPGYIAHTDLPVVVDFWAAWCGPCKTMAPNFASAAAQLPEVRFVKVDSDAAPLASAKYAVRSIPTLVLFEHGREKDRITGVLSARDLLAWLKLRTAPRST
jgi:thioredoxin 2